MDIWVALNLAKEKESDVILNLIQGIKVETIKKDLENIHNSLKEINNTKNNMSGVSFENKINRLKSENASEYEKLRRNTIPLMLETNEKIDEVMNIINEIDIKIPKKVNFYIKNMKEVLEIDCRALEKYQKHSFLK